METNGPQRANLPPKSPKWVMFLLMHDSGMEGPCAFGTHLSPLMSRLCNQFVCGMCADVCNSEIVTNQ